MSNRIRDLQDAANDIKGVGSNSIPSYTYEITVKDNNNTAVIKQVEVPSFAMAVAQANNLKNSQDKRLEWRITSVKELQ